MVGKPSESPFLFPFVIGLLIVVLLSVLTFALVIAWRYIHGRRHQPSIAAFPLPAIVEEGRATPGALDFSCRGPSRLGGISPTSGERADEETGPRLKLTVRRGMDDDGSLADVKRLDFSALQQYSTHAITASTAERVEDHAQRTKRSSVPVHLGNSVDMVAEPGRPQSFALPTSPKIPSPIPPPAPRTPGGRLSLSTVWSQESMWPRERKLEFPMPPLAYLPVPQRVRFSPIVVSGPSSPRSMNSFPRSVAPSDFGDDYY
ncbi:hypothetical protein EDB84DRAFT_936218 [Lactarius hengduanensis]|nr:hypothetical protein EDB84DRAFT_936218 [Lactarius hengduanensis]